MSHAVKTHTLVRWRLVNWMGDLISPVSNCTSTIWTAFSKSPFAMATKFCASIFCSVGNISSNVCVFPLCWSSYNCKVHNVIRRGLHTRKQKTFQTISWKRFTCKRCIKSLASHSDSPLSDTRGVRDLEFFLPLVLPLLACPLQLPPPLDNPLSVDDSELRFDLGSRGFSLLISSRRESKTNVSFFEACPIGTKTINWMANY